MRKALKGILFFAIYILGLHLLIKRFQRRRVLILMYHGLVDREKSLEWTQLPVRMFEKQMNYISRVLNPVSLDDAVRYLAGEKDIADNPVVVTFDDGYASNFSYGLGILTRYDIPATVFLATSFINSLDFNFEEPLWFDAVSEIMAGLPEGHLDISNMCLGEYDINSDKDRVRAATEICTLLKEYGPEEKRRVLYYLYSRFGPGRKRDKSHLGATRDQIVRAYPRISVGAHTVHHEILSRLPKETALWEIAESKRIIEEATSGKIWYFAYPNGGVDDFTSENLRMVAESGFKAAVTAIDGLNYPGENPYTLRRIGVGSDTGMLWFKMAVTGTIDFLKWLGL